MSAWSRHAMRGAWTFLTRVPLPGDATRADAVAAAIPAAPAWFPVVGAIVGAAVGGTYAAMLEVVGALPAAALAVSIGALITGAFHHDGLADMADAFGGGWTVEQRLAILKDSRHGTYGVMALVCALLLQVSALSQLDRGAGLTTAVVAHATARAGAVALMRFAPTASAHGLGAGATQRCAASTAAVAIASGTAIAMIALGPLAPIVIAVVAVSVALVGALAWRKIGGTNGDVLGAAEQIAETAVLLTGAAFARHVGSWPWWR